MIVSAAVLVALRVVVVAVVVVAQHLCEKKKKKKKRAVLCSTVFDMIVSAAVLVALRVVVVVVVKVVLMMTKMVERNVFCEKSRNGSSSLAYGGDGCRMTVTRSVCLQVSKTVVVVVENFVFLLVR